MYIQLTNAHPDYDNQSVVINTANIVAIYTDTVLKGTAGEFKVTCIHCPPHGTWNVKESIDQVMSMLEHVVKSDYIVANSTRKRKTISIQEITNTDIDFTV